MADVVLHASALLARIWREPGFDAVEAVIDGASVSAVNVAEVAQKMIDRGVDDLTVSLTLADLPIRIEGVDSAAGLRIGLLRRSTRVAGLSLGDRACLELASRQGFPVLTADRAWASVDVGVEVVLIR